MTSLLEKLKRGKGIPIDAAQQRDSEPDAEGGKTLPASTEDRQQATTGRDLAERGKGCGSSAAPCLACGHPIVWQDRCNGTGGPWRCMICCPPPSKAMIARQHDCRLDSADDEERELAEFNAKWETYVLPGTSPEDPGWIVTVRRGIVPPCPRDVPLAEWVKTLRTKLITDD